MKTGSNQGENRNKNIMLQIKKSKTYKGWTKKNNQNTFSVAEGLIIIVQQCYTTRWNRLDVRLKMITEPFLCDEYFLRYR